MESLLINDMHEGLSASFVECICEAEIDAFATLTGDVSPLHMDLDFALKRGFSGRVVHGGLINGYISRLCGVYLPGKNCLIHSINSNFMAPVIAGDEIKFELKVKQISESVGVVIAGTSASNVRTTEQVMRGKVQFGFTQCEVSL